jgi:3-phenylpropionate/trans-cinnamate dioxygenase ferredoxin subunit
MLTCAWHGWEFDLRTGQSWCDPARLWVRRYATRVATGAALPSGAPPGLVPGTYVAKRTRS